MNAKSPPRSSLPSSPPHSPRSTHQSPSPQPTQLPALPFRPPPSPSPSPPVYNAYHHFPHPLSILSCADLPPPTFSSNYQNPPTFRAEFRAPFFGHQHGPQPSNGNGNVISVHAFNTGCQQSGNWGVVEGGRLAGDVFASENGNDVGMGGGCGWWSRKIVYYSGGGIDEQTQQGQQDQEWQQSPTPPGSPKPRRL